MGGYTQEISDIISFVGFMKYRFLAIISKNMQVMGTNPKGKRERIEVSVQPRRFRKLSESVRPVNEPFCRGHFPKNDHNSRTENAINMKPSLK